MGMLRDTFPTSSGQHLGGLLSYYTEKGLFCFIGYGGGAYGYHNKNKPPFCRVVFYMWFGFST
jgi:hypothetical protein